MAEPASGGGVSPEPSAALHRPPDSLPPRFVSWKDITQVVADLKKIYICVTLDEAEENLLWFSEK